MDYLLYTFSIFSHYCGSYPYLTKSINHYGLQFTTRSLACFTPYYQDFYSNGKKVVPGDLYNLLTIEGVAHWICGDGTSVRGGGLILQTDNFTPYDVTRLISVLIYKFQCKCTIRYQRGNPVIYISKRSVKRITPELIKHVPFSMFYKLQIDVNKAGQTRENSYLSEEQ